MIAARAVGRMATRCLLQASSRTAPGQLATGAATSATARTSSRAFASVMHDVLDHDDREHRLPVTAFTEDEEMAREAARAWADQELRPLVREMDDECKTRPEVVQGLFDHGFMGMVSVDCLTLIAITAIASVIMLASLML